MRLLLTTDTHLPKRAKRLPDPLLDELARADVVFHAGDWVDTETLDLFEARSRRLVGVYGNNDGPALRARLPEVAYVELEGVRFAVVHETGEARGRERRCAERFPHADVLVFGHSHIPWDSTAVRASATSGDGTGDGTGEGTGTGQGVLRLLNPGSPTDRRRQPYCTYMTAESTSEGLSRVQLHRLPRR